MRDGNQPERMYPVNFKVAALGTCWKTRKMKTKKRYQDGLKAG